MSSKQWRLILKVLTRRALGYFLKGAVLVLPTVLTIYLIFKVISWIDELITANFSFMPIGSGLVIILVGLTLVGLIGGSIILSPFEQLFKIFVEKTPGIKLLYKPIKDFLEALVGEKKKFSSPVLVQLSVVPEIWQLGFVTQNSLDFLGLDGYISVYCPKSYGFLGELIVVKAENIKPIDGKMNASEVMKFVVSGGVAADADEEEH